MKNLVKSILGLTASKNRELKARLDRSLTVFVFHDVTDEPSTFSRECGLAVNPQQFEFQIRFVAEAFNVVSLDQLLSGKLPQRAALITFDDGLQSIFRQALPILHRLRLPFTVFLNMGPVFGDPFWSAQVVYLCHHVPGFKEFLMAREGRMLLEECYFACSPAVVEEWENSHGNDYLKALPSYMGSYVTWEELKAVDSNSLVTFGNHLYNHYSMRRLADSRNEAEFFANADALSSLRGTRPVFAFPFGRPGLSFTRRHIRLLLSWGQKRLFTGLSLLNEDPEGPLLHRVSLTDWHQDRLRVWFEISRAARNGLGRTPAEVASLENQRELILTS